MFSQHVHNVNFIIIILYTSVGNDCQKDSCVHAVELHLPVGKLWVSAVNMICLVDSLTSIGLASDVSIGCMTGTEKPFIALFQWEVI